MKQLMIVVALFSLALTGCRNRAEKVVVKETYLHKYGVPVPKEDWARNGKDGQVVQLRNDGVTVSKSFEHGVLQGPVTYSYPNSTTVEKIELYDRGLLLSVTRNFLSGVPHEMEKYEGQQIKEVSRWYEDGTPSAFETYENGLMVTGEYRTPLNAVESVVENGLGTRIARGNDGELLSKDSIVHGQMVERVTYFQNGDPASVTSYENGLAHGTRLTFALGGLPKTVEQWMHGQQEGMTIVYLNGEKVAEVPYVKGEKHGTELRYQDGQTVVEEISWKRGVQHGPRKIISEEVTKTEWYNQGELVSRTTFERMNPPTS